MQKLNDREQRVYDYIVKTIKERGYAPSVRDIREALDYKSTSTVHMYLGRLEMLGYIVKDEGKSRALRLCDELPSTDGVPLLGRVTAGLPILAVENYEGVIPFVPHGGYQKSNLFALRVQGESMIDAGILDGDVVIVNRTSYADNGEIVVAMVEDSATVKRFFKEDGHYRLQPENKTMQPIIVKRAEVLGKVIAVQRYY
ncbi:MAG: transcriptional repressor LexA [Clostridia bacterium]|jgi:repressor LexA|nr:transcriptional repressor LexA [Clostridia bacterium]MBQ5362037.1 transcriptional repressor LexA [Clostridia bacterium]